MVSDIEIQRSGQGYYTLYVNGEFAGNCDTPQEASQDAEELLGGRKEPTKEALAV